MGLNSWFKIAAQTLGLVSAPEQPGRIENQPDGERCIPCEALMRMSDKEFWEAVGDSGSDEKMEEIDRLLGAYYANQQPQDENKQLERRDLI